MGRFGSGCEAVVEDEAAYLSNDIDDSIKKLEKDMEDLEPILDTAKANGRRIVDDPDVKAADDALALLESEEKAIEVYVACVTGKSYWDREKSTGATNSPVQQPARVCILGALLKIEKQHPLIARSVRLSEDKWI